MRQRGLLVVDMETANEHREHRQHLLDQNALDWYRRLVGAVRPIRTRDRILLLQQMALMIRNGLTVLQALDVVRQHSSNRQYQSLLDRLSDAIQSGTSLSQAMAREQRYFSHLTVKLIESAEVSGELDQTMERAARHLERGLELRRQLLTSLTYPAIVVLTSIAVVVFLVWKVIPRFAQFFIRRGAELPWSTQLLMDASAVVTQYGLPLLAAGAGLFAVLAAVYWTRPGRLMLDRAVLKLPVVGKLITAAAVSHGSTTLATLLHSGVTLLESLRITAMTLGNRAFTTTVGHAAERILEGQDLATSLRQPVLPPMVPHIVAVGERTGALGEVFDELGTFYDRQLQSAIRQMTALIEPVMILIIGGIVGFVYFSFFQAVFQLALAGR